MDLLPLAKHLRQQRFEGGLSRRGSYGLLGLDGLDQRYLDQGACTPFDRAISKPKQKKGWHVKIEPAILIEMNL